MTWLEKTINAGHRGCPRPYRSFSGWAYRAAKLELYANLAYGVTTAHDPSANTETVFTPFRNGCKVGALVGPRIFSTGFILYGADGDFKAVINKLEDARFSVRRTKAFGATAVKSYNQPRRDQRQQVTAGCPGNWG